MVMSTSHGVVVKPSEAEDIELEERAKALLKKNVQRVLKISHL
jgi:hypothetical protein